MQPPIPHAPTPRRAPPTPPWRRAWNSAPALILRRYPGLVLVPLAFFVAAAFEDSVTSGPIICIFRLVSGLPCAGCGMTRGFVAIAHGYVNVALHYNLFAPLLFAWMGGWWLFAVVRLWRGQGPVRHPSWLIKGAVVVLLSYWLIRAGWFASQPGAWRDMVDTSPLLRLFDWLLA